MSWKIGRFIEVSTLRGEPMEIGTRRIVPVVRTLLLSIGRPGARASARLAWTRAVAVEVTDGAGMRRLAITDVGTRIAVGLVLASTTLLILARLLRGAGNTCVDRARRTRT